MQKIITVITGLIFFLLGKIDAQTQGWQNLDQAKDSVFGISADKAYQLLKEKKPKHVLVAVIDGGIDTVHEDLRTVIWNNPKVQKNGKQNKNGYVNDFHGWNFIGGAKGDVQYDNLEATRLYRKQHDFYDSLSDGIVPEKYRESYHSYRVARANYYGQLESAEN